MQQQRQALQATSAFQEKEMSGRVNVKQTKIQFQQANTGAGAHGKPSEGQQQPASGPGLTPEGGDANELKPEK